MGVWISLEVSVIFKRDKFSGYVGVNTTFERQFYLPTNGINLKDDSHVISLQYRYFLEFKFIADTLA